jgi:hypothetical protein
LADNNELLPHVFLGDVARFVIAEAIRSPASFAIMKVLNVMEFGLASEKEVRELVAVSFVENLCGEDDALSVLVLMMGPALRKEFKMICGG